MLANLNEVQEDKEQGFTLVELMVVVCIMGILMAIAIPAYLSQRQAAVDSSVIADLKNAATIIETWKVSSPAGVPSQSVIADIKKSDPNTTLNVDSLAEGEYTITGTNPNGDRSVSGLTYSSITDEIE